MIVVTDIFYNNMEGIVAEDEWVYLHWEEYIYIKADPTEDHIHFL